MTGASIETTLELGPARFGKSRGGCAGCSNRSEWPPRRTCFRMACLAMSAVKPAGCALRQPTILALGDQAILGRCAPVADTLPMLSLLSCSTERVQGWVRAEKHISATEVLEGLGHNNIASGLPSGSVLSGSFDALKQGAMNGLDYMNSVIDGAQVRKDAGHAAMLRKTSDWQVWRLSDCLIVLVSTRARLMPTGGWALMRHIFGMNATLSLPLHSSENSGFIPLLQFGKAAENIL